MKLFPGFLLIITATSLPTTFPTLTSSVEIKEIRPEIVLRKARTLGTTNIPSIFGNQLPADDNITRAPIVPVRKNDDGKTPPPHGENLVPQFLKDSSQPHNTNSPPPTDRMPNIQPSSQKHRSFLKPPSSRTHHTSTGRVTKSKRPNPRAQKKAPEAAEVPKYPENSETGSANDGITTQRNYDFSYTCGFGDCHKEQIKRQGDYRYVTSIQLIGTKLICTFSEHLKEEHPKLFDSIYGDTARYPGAALPNPGPPTVSPP
jgi:hypothetical protein